MKHKKSLFIIFFVTLLMYQQAQASTNVPFEHDPSKIDLVQGNGIPTQIYINMLRLNENGTVFQPRQPCVYGQPAFGCGEGGATYLETNPMLVNVENDYLLDVLPREMNVAENNPTLEALQAQALAARSLLAWKAKYIPDPEATNGYINNS